MKKYEITLDQLNLFIKWINKMPYENVKLIENEVSDLIKIIDQQEIKEEIKEDNGKEK